MSRSIHVATNDIISFFLTTEKYLYICHIFFIIHLLMNIYVAFIS